MEDSDETASYSGIPRRTKARPDDCDCYVCTTSGITIDKPCKCDPRPSCHLDCILCEAIQHWNSCSGCKCEPNKTYPCPDCGHLITLTPKPPSLNIHSILGEMAYGSVAGVASALLASLLAVVVPYILLIVLLMTTKTLPLTLCLATSVTPLLTVLFDGKRILFSTASQLARAIMLMILGAVVACSTASVILMLIQPRILMEDSRYILLVLNALANLVVGFTTLWNFSMLIALLRPRVI